MESDTKESKKKLENFLVKSSIGKPKISVVIPCYNVEKYIEQCISSLIRQTFKEMEIICVDDGSKDSTLKKLENFEKLDSRIKVITQENSGPSRARNAGISAARGNYITFIDSDDWIDEDYLEKLYSAITKNDCDIATATIIRKRPHSQKYRIHYSEEKIYTSLKDKMEICVIPKCCYIWNKLYKSELVKNKKMKEGVYFEDVLWLPQVLKDANKIITVPGTNYYYRATGGSIVKKPSAKKQIDSYNAHKFIVEFFEENNLDLEKKYKRLTKKIGYFLNIPIYRIKEFGGWDVFYLFNLIPLFKYSKTKYRDFYKVLGLKFTVRKNKKPISEIREYNLPYEEGLKDTPIVKSRFETLETLINSEKSICRYGDGEFNLIFGESLPFQKYDKNLAKRLGEILVSNDKEIMICIPDIFGSLSHLTSKAADFWRKTLYYNRDDIENLLDLNKTYYDALVTRPYMDSSDKSNCKNFFSKFKEFVKGKDIVIAEGETSRLGVGNDLFDSAKTIKRIICPAKDAFSNYENILNECLKFSKDSLYIIALGPTATVLAYDLAKHNRRALDLGHIDIEYEWFLMGAKEKVPIKNKYVNECKNGKVITKINDSEYLTQISANLSEVR